MRLPFKKNHIPKGVRVEQARREQIIRNLYKLLVENCSSAMDLKSRADIVHEQLKGIYLKKRNDNAEEFKAMIESQKLSEWLVKAQDGKGKETEQKIIDFLCDEEIKTVDFILDAWKNLFDAFARKDLLERPADSLKIIFKQ